MSITIRVTQNEEWIDFDVPTEWKDISIEYWAKLSMIIKTHQKNSELKKESHQERYGDFEDIAKILEDVEFVDNLSLNKDIFCFLSGLDKEDMKKVDITQVNKVIDSIGVLTEEYQPKGMRSFEFEEETYYFPSELLKENTYGDFIEATQLDMTVKHMKNGRYDILPEQMAILCRKMDEDYDEKAIPDKTEKFKKLTMDTVFEFAFFLTKHSERLLTISNTYLEKKEKV